MVGRGRGRGLLQAAAGSRRRKEEEITILKKRRTTTPTPTSPTRAATITTTTTNDSDSDRDRDRDSFNHGHGHGGGGGGCGGMREMVWWRNRNLCRRSCSCSTSCRSGSSSNSCSCRYITPPLVLVFFVFFYFYFVIVVDTTSLRSTTSNNNDRHQHQHQPQMIIVDVISMGNTGNQSMLALEAQEQTWFQELGRLGPGQALALAKPRFFFKATEKDDYCFTEECLKDPVSRKERNEVCNNPNNNNNNSTSVPDNIINDKPKFWRKKFQSFDSKPLGWWCAQKRTMCGLMEFMKRYVVGGDVVPAGGDDKDKDDVGDDYPDWLLIVDDDTWMSPYLLPPLLHKAMTEFSSTKKNPSSSPPKSAALTPAFGASASSRSEGGVGPRSIHYGGTGIAIPKEILKVVFQKKVVCSTTGTTSNSNSAVGVAPAPGEEEDVTAKEICKRLNISGYLDGGSGPDDDGTSSADAHPHPKPSFEDGMSLLLFMNKLLSRRVSCLHSDWWQGLMIWLAGFEVKLFDCPTCPFKKGREIYSKGLCGPTMLACHRMNHRRIRDMTERTIMCYKDKNMFSRWLEPKCRSIE